LAARECEAGVETPPPTNLLLDRIVEGMTRQGWGLQSRTESTAAFARDEGADGATVCCLAFLFLLPAILYMLLYNTTRRVTVSAYPHGGGSPGSSWAATTSRRLTR
jgi:hypothetical protein